LGTAVTVALALLITATTVGLGVLLIR